MVPPRNYNKSKSPDLKKNEQEDNEFDDEETIDEFIKKHLDEDKVPKDQIDPDLNRDFDNLSGSDPSETSLDQSSGISPKQSLLTALLRLSDSNDDSIQRSSQQDKELFIQDLESILKVITFKETCLLVFPCLEAYACEEDYLKIELFK